VSFPVWGPGALLAYASIDRGSADIYLKDFSRDDPPVPLKIDHPELAKTDKMPTSWSPDGSHLLVTVLAKDRRYGLWVIPVSPAGVAVPLRPGEGSQVSGRVSPDGRTALYIRRAVPSREGEPPERELWTCDFPSGTHPRLVVTGAVDPAWMSNTEVSFFDRAGRLRLLALDGSVPGPRTAHIETGVNTPEAARNNYVWAADGTRVLVNQPEQGGKGIRVMVLLNAAVRVSDRAPESAN
jgi:Tol biopolymer transport system component